MSTSTVANVIVRRWYVTLVGLLATVALCFAASVVARPSYQAAASVLLLPTEPHKGANPYLDLGGLLPVADVLARSLSDASTAQTLKNQGYTGTYSAERDQSVAGPVLILTAKANTAKGALRLLHGVDNLVQPRLIQLQRDANVRASAMVNSRDLSIPTKATAITKTQMRAIVAAAVVGLFLTLMLVLGVHRILLRRTRRRALEAGGTDDGSENPAPDEPPGRVEAGGDGSDETTDAEASQPVDTPATNRGSRKARDSAGLLTGGPGQIRVTQRR